jgi:lysophospholipase L1-like esterase
MLEGVLREHRGEAIEVLNAGVQGYSSYQGLLRFRAELVPFRPDLVFVSFGWNDLPAAVGRSDKEFRPSPANVALQRLLLRYDGYLVLKAWMSHGRAATTLQRARVPPEDYAENLRGFWRSARAAGVDVVYLTRPHRASLAELAQDPSWRRLVPEYNRIVRTIAQETGALVLDVEEWMSDRSWFVDECHFTQEGHQKLGVRIVEDPRFVELLARSRHDP